MKDVFGANLFSKDSIFQVSRNSLFREVAAIFGWHEVQFYSILHVDFAARFFSHLFLNGMKFNHQTDTFDVLNWENFQELSMQCSPSPASTG